MKEEFKITENDYLKAQLLSSKLGKKEAIHGLIILSILIVGIVFNNKFVIFGAVGGAIGGLTILVLNRLLVIPLNARKQYRGYKSIQTTICVELFEDGIQITNPYTQSKTPWENFYKWRDDEDYVLLYIMPKMFYVLPKKQLSHSQIIPAITEKLERTLGKST